MKVVEDENVNMTENYNFLKTFETTSKTDKSQHNTESYVNGIITENTSKLNNSNFNINSSNSKPQKDFNSWGYIPNRSSTDNKKPNASHFTSQISK